jgi:putative PIN family toxin of toxin-antitoxin system
MAPRKERIAVVLDTNVIIGHYLSRSAHSVNSRIFRLWRDQRQLQSVVSEELVEEYLQILVRLRVDEQRVQRFQERLRTRSTVMRVSLGTRYSDSRDPKDNFLLATAAVAKAAFLVSNDRDLLDIAPEARRKFRFEIVTPHVLLDRLAQ